MSMKENDVYNEDVLENIIEDELGETNCPACGSLMSSHQNQCTNITICQDCSYVGFRYYGKADLQNFVKYIQADE